MVGLVLVSHSRPLAEALHELIRQVSQSELPVAIAAGVGEDRSEFGTDAIEIAEAIQQVHSDDGVLVLMDLGSAVISAELALEFLPEDLGSSVLLCPAPLVEGSIAAAVVAAHGSDLEAVCAEALGALEAKDSQIAGVQTSAPAAPRTAAEAGALDLSVTLHNQHGLHARPAASVVKALRQFDARVEAFNLTRGTGPRPADSLNGLTTLGALRGDEVRFTAAGPEARQALAALQALVDNNFGEGDQVEAAARVPQASQTDDPDALQAIPISEGIAIGPVFQVRLSTPQLPNKKATNSQEAWKTFRAAIHRVGKKIEERAKSALSTLGTEQAAIFEAHLLILEDPELLAEIRSAIFDEHLHEAVAWDRAISQLAERYRSLEDPYLRQRAVDIEDVGRQGLLELTGNSRDADLELPQPSILIADDLTPTQTALIDLERVLGLVTLAGGPTSHSAILARARGIPAVGGADPALRNLADGSLLGLDGGDGLLWVDPKPELVAALKAKNQVWREARDRMRRQAAGPAATQDGHRIIVTANIGGAQDAADARRLGAEGVGLLRTEFLFLTRQDAPDESTQVLELQEAAEAMGDRPIKVRTLDAGGDKELPYLELPHEANPYLGVRAIRLSLGQRELFHTQLRAILRAGFRRQFSVMFPMVSTLDEIRQARRMLAEAHQSLEEDGIPHAWPIGAGMMVETPAAALLSLQLAPEVDFFSIGTNDLTQYTLAAERGHPALAAMADALNPAVLQLIQRVADAARAHGIRASVCGELAGDLAAAPVLIGLGVEELSLNPAGIPAVKAVIRATTREQAAEIAAQALAAPDTETARRVAETFYRGLKLD